MMSKAFGGYCWGFSALLLGACLIQPVEARNEQFEDVYVGYGQGGQWILLSSGGESECFGLVQQSDSGRWWQFNRKNAGGLSEWAFKLGNVTLLSPWFASLKEFASEKVDAPIQISQKGEGLLLPNPLNPLALPIEMEKWVSLERHAEVRDVALASTPLTGRLDDDRMAIEFDFPKITYLSTSIEGIGELFNQQIARMQEQFIHDVGARQENLQMDRGYTTSSRQAISVYFVEIGSDAVWMLFYADQYALLSREVKLATLLLQKGIDGNWQAGDPAPANLGALRPHRIGYRGNDPLEGDLMQPTVSPEGWLPRNIGIWSAGVQGAPAEGITFAEFR